MTYKTLPAQSQTCWERFDPAASQKLFRGKVGYPIGKILIINETNPTVTVILSHPDSDGRAFAVWNIKPGSQNLRWDGKPINIGANWGINIGSSSCIGPVGKAAKTAHEVVGHDEMYYYIRAN
ncbi:hypothetical protein QUB19_21160 [Microcoleus sp. B4-C5]|uniref:hypothetical protein n=1 Tax=unclassified Microcoleus TaxID=2642155 RepID=UPI002FD72876